MALMAQRWRGRPQIWGFWLVTAVHFIVAFYYFSIVKLDFTSIIHMTVTPSA